MPTEDIPQKAKDLYTEAVRILQEDIAQQRTMRGTEIVIDNLKEAVEEHDEYFEAWRLLGEIYLGTEQTLYGYLALRKALQLQENDPPVATLLGEACLILGRSKLALEFLEIAFKAENVPLASKKLRAVALARAEKWDEVLAAFGEALAEDPSDGDIRRECARILNELGYQKEAASVLADYIDPHRHYIEKQPAITESKWIMKTGTVLDRLKSGSAKIAAEKEVVSRSEDYHAWYAFGNIFLDGEKYNAAVTCYKRALRIHPDYYDALHNMGLALEEMERNDDALQMYEAAIEANPDIPEAYMSIAELLEEMSPEETDEIALNYLMYYRLNPGAEGFEELEKDLRARLEESPDIAQILLLVQVYLQREEVTKAQGVIKLIESSVGEEAAIHWLMGRILHEQGDTAGAERAYKLGLDLITRESSEQPLDEDDVEARLLYDFAALMEETDKPAEARKILEQDTEVLNADGLTLLAELLLADDPLRAEETWQSAVVLEPDHTDALMGVADLMIETDRMVEGIILLEQALKADPDDETIIERLRELYPKIDAPELSP